MTHYITIKTTTGTTMLKTAHISAVTITEGPWYEVHLESGTIFRSMDENGKLKDWCLKVGGQYP